MIIRKNVINFKINTLFYYILVQFGLVDKICYTFDQIEIIKETNKLKFNYLLY